MLIPAFCLDESWNKQILLEFVYPSFSRNRTELQPILVAPRKQHAEPVDVDVVAKVCSVCLSKGA